MKTVYALCLLKFEAGIIERSMVHAITANNFNLGGDVTAELCIRIGLAQWLGFLIRMLSTASSVQHYCG